MLVENALNCICLLQHLDALLLLSDLGEKFSLLNIHVFEFGCTADRLLDEPVDHWVAHFFVACVLVLLWLHVLNHGL